ncbi:uncharacterized protein LOC144661241 [Oculina patagonica]
MELHLNPTLYLLFTFFATFLNVASGSCNDFDLGVGSGSIADSKITASSVQSASTPAKNDRLNHTAGSPWCAGTSDTNPYLQIDLQTLHIICAVSTQGNSRGDQWVKTYIIQSSTDGSNWTNYNETGQLKLFKGNEDRNSEVKHVLFDGIFAKYLRFLPKTHHNSVCMRTEVFGVKRKPENLALGKPAAQSSTYSDAAASGVAGKAVDGTSDTDFHHGHCSHTLLNSPSWWRVDLGLDPVPVSEVYIANRFSTNELIRQRNKDYKITIGSNPNVTDNPQCMGLYSFIQFKASAVCFTNPLTTGRYVGIVTKNSFLTLCEVEIYLRENLAFGKQTDQISTYRDCVSSRAVDGNSNTSLYAGSTCASTRRATKPWWRVDLGREEPVSELYIVNRGDCCGARLYRFEIRVGPMSRDGGVTNPKCGDIHTVPQGKGLSFYCRPYLYGRYVTVRSLRNNEPLTLCEVEVYSARRACQIQAIGAASSKTLPHDSFSASSTTGFDAPSKGRLNGRGAWSPSNDNNVDDYLQIDLQYEFFICAVATQGKSTADHWTTKYKLHSSLNDKDWVTYQENRQDKVFNGNSGRNDIVKHNLKEITSARFIRFQPTLFSTRKALRIEVFGVLKPAVPSQAPSNFTVVAWNTTSMKASWQLPPANSRRGIITGFKLFYKKKDAIGMSTTLTINGGAISSKYVTELEMYTEYEFQVLAFTSAGDGPKSSVKVERTMGDALEWSNQKPSSPTFAPNLRQGGVMAKITLPRFPGHARFFQIIVLRLSSDYNGVVETPGNFTPQDLLTYEDAHASPISTAYVTFQFGGNDFDMYQEFVIGNGALSNNNGSEKEYHNKPLQPSTNYRVFLRAFVKKNVYISTNFVKVETKVPPTIIEDVFPTSVICEKQTPCLLSCYATSDTPVNYTWTKVGQGSVSDDVKFMNKSIVVTPRGAQDYGVYVCNATNSFGTASNEITLIEGRKLSAGVAMNKRGDNLSQIYGITVIALSCTVFMLLIVIGLLACRLKRAELIKSTTTADRDTANDVNEHDSPPRDPHEPEGDSYMELEPRPFQRQSNAPSEYQSLQSTDVSSEYYNVGFAQPRPLERQSHAPSEYQSLQGTNTSSTYYNVGFAQPSPMDCQSHVTSGCQSLQRTNISSAYYNVAFINANSEQDSEVYYEIGNTQC